MTLSVLPVTGIPEVREGDEIVGLVAAAIDRQSLRVEDGDVLVVSSKVVSKAVGLTALPGDRAAVVAAQTRRVVAERVAGDRLTQVVEAAAGPVMAGAGVDASNTGGADHLLLLPPDPDSVCRQLRAGFRRTFGVGRLGVVLSDTAGRPWRVGQTDFALGAAGVAVVDDLRGGVDADGRPLDVTTRAVADEIAAAADLVKGKTERIPVAVVRGLPWWVVPADKPEPTAGARSLVRTGPDDWFSHGAAEAVRAALGVEAGSDRARVVGVPSVGDEPATDRLARAVAVALVDLESVGIDVSGLEAGARIHGRQLPDPERGDVVVSGPDPVERGIAAARLCVALWGEGFRARIEGTGGETGAVRIGFVPR